MITVADSIPYICRFIYILYWVDSSLLKSGRLGQILISHCIDDQTGAQCVINQYMVNYGKELNTKIFQGLFHYLMILNEILCLIMGVHYDLRVWRYMNCLKI